MNAFPEEFFRLLLELFSFTRRRPTSFIFAQLSTTDQLRSENTKHGNKVHYHECACHTAAVNLMHHTDDGNAT